MTGCPSCDIFLIGCKKGLGATLMQFIKDRFTYLFNSTKGLILVAIAMIGIVTAIWGMLSGPMAEMGVREIVIRLLGMDIVQAEREGRIIILYHSIAMAIVAIETYIVTS